MGKGGDKTAVPANVKKEVRIDGRYYDITNLKHPGGSVIHYYSEKDIDATEAFANFHIRSKKAKKTLELLPSRPADKVVIAKTLLPGQGKLMEDFNNFQRELEAEGFFKPSIPHVIYRFTELLVLHVVGFWLLRHNYILPALIFLGIGTGRCGWLMHEGGHYSLTGELILQNLGCFSDAFIRQHWFRQDASGCDLRGGLRNER
jgi:fatty acid desaturase 2 (delta-6 desaturase)